MSEPQRAGLLGAGRPSAAFARCSDAVSDSQAVSRPDRSSTSRTERLTAASTGGGTPAPCRAAADSSTETAADGVRNRAGSASAARTSAVIGPGAASPS
jgi:hypothetical protein